MLPSERCNYLHFLRVFDRPVEEQADGYPQHDESEGEESDDDNGRFERAEGAETVAQHHSDRCSVGDLDENIVEAEFAGGEVADQHPWLDDPIITRRIRRGTDYLEDESPIGGAEEHHGDH